jgi:hypothetical protein
MGTYVAPPPAPARSPPERRNRQRVSQATWIDLDLQTSTSDGAPAFEFVNGEVDAFTVKRAQRRLHSISVYETGDVFVIASGVTQENSIRALGYLEDGTPNELQKIRFPSLLALVEDLAGLSRSEGVTQVAGKATE